LDVTKTGTGLELLTEIDADHHRVCRLTESLEGRKQVETLPRKISTKTIAERPSSLRLRKIILPTEESYDSPGFDDDSDDEYTTGERDSAIPASMNDLASHPNLALLHEPDHATAAVFQHKEQPGSASTPPPKNNMADIVDPFFSTCDVPQTGEEAPDPNIPCVLFEPGVRVKDLSGREDIRKGLRQALVENEQNREPDTGGLSTFASCVVGGIEKHRWLQISCGRTTTRSSLIPYLDPC
jgi:hypothetical protein